MQTATVPDVEAVAEGVLLVHDTCNVYVITTTDASGERTAATVDFGSGRVLELLDELGITRITDVLMTHHHRDQGQGLPRAVEHGARIHVPPVEVDLFTRVEDLWQSRDLENDYNLRQDRFSLRESVPIAGTVPLYRDADYGGIRLRAVPTPGHTPGSLSYLLERDGERIAFTGDLIYAPGKVWSMAATQWTYTGHEGPAMMVLACRLLRDERPTLLLPSHGRPMGEPDTALKLLERRMQQHVNSKRRLPWDVVDRLRNPFRRLTPHLLMNISALSYSYVLLSHTGEALFIDYGYDMTTGLPSGQDRASRLTWLASLPALKRDYGVTRVSVALPTHYHDDHIAGMPLLREVEGAEIWAPEHVGAILADPWLEDLPCQWYEPIVADRLLEVGGSFTWNEYTITVHDQPGHTLYHVAYETEVDGVRVLFTGDQQEGLGVPGQQNEVLNYQYRNRFHIDDYERSARLYRERRPALLASGHWTPHWVEPDWFDQLLASGKELGAQHRALLPLDELDTGVDGVMARLAPYRSQLAPGSRRVLEAVVRNPYDTATDAVLELHGPEDWDVGSPVRVRLEAGEEKRVPFAIRVGPVPTRRARLALDVTIGELRLGEHTDAVIEILG